APVDGAAPRFVAPTRRPRADGRTARLPARGLSESQLAVLALHDAIAEVAGEDAQRPQPRSVLVPQDELIGRPALRDEPHAPHRVPALLAPTGAGRGFRRGGDVTVERLGRAPAAGAVPFLALGASLRGSVALVDSGPRGITALVQSGR